MKIRNGFVSNSSSSSFIVINNESLIPKGINYSKLNKEQKERLVKQGFEIDVKDNIFLTQFISDCLDEHFQMWHDEDSGIERKGVLEYGDGGHGHPYDEEQYDEISDNVWLNKEGSDHELKRCPHCDADISNLFK